MRVTHLIEPRLVVESHSVDDERIAILIPPDRVSPPLRVGIGRVLAIQPHRSKIRPELVKDVYRFGGLNELCLDRPEVDVGSAWRLAIENLRVRGFIELG